MNLNDWITPKRITGRGKRPAADPNEIAIGIHRSGRKGTLHPWKISIRLGMKTKAANWERVETALNEEGTALAIKRSDNGSGYKIFKSGKTMNVCFYPEMLGDDYIVEAIEGVSQARADIIKSKEKYCIVKLPETVRDRLVITQKESNKSLFD